MRGNVKKIKFVFCCLVVPEAGGPAGGEQYPYVRLRREEEAGGRDGGLRQADHQNARPAHSAALGLGQ